MDKKIELQVLSITNSQAQVGAYAMLLGEVNGSRKLPIIIGPAEAQSTALCLKGAKTPRPLTHELLNTCITVLGATLYRVLIYKAKDGIFYSYIYLRKEDEIIRIDARTTDAVAPAVRSDASIFIYESILEKEGLHIQDVEIEELDEDNESPAQSSAPSLSVLQEELDEAIRKENYELAARLRDEIQRQK